MYSSGSLMRRLVGVALAALVAVAIAAPIVSASSHHRTRPQGTTPASVTLPYQNARLPIKQRVRDLLSRMTLAEKIGQMTQAERGSVDADTTKITTDNLGSLLSGGGSVPTPNTPAAWADMVDRYQRAALATRLHIPLIYGIDTGSADGDIFRATVFPHNIGLGASRDPALVRAVERVRRGGDAHDESPVGVSAPACASLAMIAGGARTSRLARIRPSYARWRPQSTGSRALPAISRIPIACWPRPSTSPATA